MKTALLVTTLSTLVACLYFTIVRPAADRTGQKHIVISSDHQREEIIYKGVIRLNKEETAFDSMSAGGYMRYETNDNRLEVKRDREGNWVYRLNTVRVDMASNPSARAVYANAVREMVAYGFDAGPRLEHIYRSGGQEAVLAAVDSLQNDQIKALYLEKLLSAGHLPDTVLVRVVHHIGGLFSSGQRTQFLLKLSPDQLSDTTVLDQWLNVAGKLFAPAEKKQALEHIAGHNILSGNTFDEVMDIIREMPSDWEKSDLAMMLMPHDVHTEVQWVTLIDMASKLRAEHDRRTLLAYIGDRMPSSDTLRTALRAAGGFLPRLGLLTN